MTQAIIVQKNGQYVVAGAGADVAASLLAQAEAAKNVAVSSATAAETAADQADSLAAALGVAWPELAAVFGTDPVLSRLTEGTNNGGHSVSRVVSMTSGTSYTMLALVLADGRSIINLAATAGAPINTTFNLATGTIKSLGASNTASIRPLGRSVYLLSATATATSSGSGQVIWRIDNGDDNFSYEGDGVSGLYLPMVSLRETSATTELLPSRDPADASLTKSGCSIVAKRLTTTPAFVDVQSRLSVIEASGPLNRVRALDGYPSLLPRVLIEGDSIMAANHEPLSGSTFGTTNAKGELIWAHSTYPYFEIDQWGDPTDTTNYSRGCNVAVGGNTTAQVIARLDATTDIAADFIALAIGINDINGGGTASGTMANIETIVQRFVGLGKTVLLANLRPVGAAFTPQDWSNGSSRVTQLLALNTMIADFAAVTPNVHLVDLMAAYSNGANPPRPRAGETYDELHPSRTGAWRGGQAWRAALKKLIKPFAISRPTSANVISNGLMVGGGGLTGSGVTGTVARDWIAGLAASGSSTASAVASKNGNDQQVITITPGGATWEQVQIARTSGGAVIVEGRWYKALMRFRLSASAAAKWRGFTFQCGSQALAFGTSTEIYSAIIPETGEKEYHVETPVFKGPTGGEVGELIIRFAIDGTAPTPMTITILEIFCGEVADPNPLHGFGV